ncbi:MAG: FAD-dependent oxidoreductase [Fretibacterium sp.]|nr:FAD-dependent oxidoreductase [Fretibacterium sp.]
MGKTVLILGGGVTGCTAAREFSGKGFNVTLIEKNNYLGGGCHTFFWGGHPYTEGPRPFHVVSEKEFAYINDIVPMRRFPLFLDTYIERDRSFYSFPIHWDDIQVMPDREQILKELDNCPKENNAANLEQGWINAVGPTLYDKYVRTYTQKMWEVESNTVFDDFSWSVKGSPIQKGSRVVELATGKPEHAYPIEETGYNRFFDCCVKDAKVILGAAAEVVDLENRKVAVNGEILSADIIVSTIALDDLMHNAYGELRYMGRDFYPMVFPAEHIFRNFHHFIHYPNEEKYTRIVEYKNLTGHQSKDTLLVMEVPSHSNRLYSYNIKSEKDKAQKYMDNLPDDVYAVGRLGTYRYLNIGQCFEAVWSLTEKV